jgi:hypothetical protein
MILSMMIVIGILILFSLLLWKKLQKKSFHSRKSIKCEPEIIRPLPPKKGLCGIHGCKIRIQHSHVLDLVEKLNQK